MAINVKPNFTVDDVRQRYDAFLDVVEELQLEALQQLGEECVTFARSDHANDWQDQTGNLRSSIGYMIFKDGKVVFGTPFEQVAAKIRQKTVCRWMAQNVARRCAVPSANKQRA